MKRRLVTEDTYIIFELYLLKLSSGIGALLSLPSVSRNLPQLLQFGESSNSFTMFGSKFSLKLLISFVESTFVFLMLPPEILDFSVPSNRISALKIIPMRSDELKLVKFESDIINKFFKGEIIGYLCKTEQEGEILVSDYPKKSTLLL
ncbi:MAG: hypothetical protein EZS28_003436 [Streblomastix strix]|uniref:Uncharacterized protein n=1 Tax=Streblomastix strix TaxID=222440 RepID=A0A5J4X213_9EUKA|nr:MAG: hypothetical protein EZS28_003436 [Streblomastix strix]